MRQQRSAMRVRPAAVAFACLCGLASGQPLRMVLQWEHQSQFAGYYMAEEKGFYKEQGLEVAIIPGGAHVDPLRMVREGKAEMCSTMLATALHDARQNQTRWALLAQVINRSNLCLVAWKEGRDESGRIERPEDLDRKRVTVWPGFTPPYQRFFDQHRITPEILPQYYTVSLFLHRGTDACCAMLYNEVHALRQCDIPAGELTIFDFHELGIRLPEDGVYCLQETWAARRDDCIAFARASMRGWDYARQHPQETLDVVMRHVEQNNLPTNRAHMKWMLETILASVYPPDDKGWTPGVLSEPSYREALTIMGQSAPAYADFVTEAAQHAGD